jgi:hypothetical protein
VLTSFYACMLVCNTLAYMLNCMHDSQRGWGGGNIIRLDPPPGVSDKFEYIGQFEAILKKAIWPELRDHLMKKSKVDKLS